MTAQTHETDILIIGAGPGGCAAALFLAKQGVKCTIVDKEKFPRDKICGDALSGKVVEVLKRLDASLMDELNAEATALGSWGVTFVAPNGEALRVPFKKKLNKQSAAPGFITKRADFDNWLVEKVRANSLCTLMEEVQLRDYMRDENGYTVASKDGAHVFRTKLIIAADGAYSAFAKQHGSIETEPAHNCFGLRAYYKGVEGLDADNFIELHFIHQILPGYFWIFPLPNGEANIGIGMRADKMSKKKVHLKKELEKLLAAHPVISKRFAKAEKIGEIKQWGLPLGSKQRKLSGDHYMLIGDAASLIDPFTGEGIGNAMMSGLFAAQQAVKCVEQNNFSAAFMQHYDTATYARLWSELLLSYRMQQLVNFPPLFNFVVRKANTNSVLRETISCMFEDLDLRDRLRKPSFYFSLLFSQPVSNTITP